MAQAPGKRGKRLDKRPARGRYWSSGALAETKIRRILSHNRPWRRPPESLPDGTKTEGVRMEPWEVKQQWLTARAGRRMKGVSK